MKVVLNKNDFAKQVATVDKVRAVLASQQGIDTASALRELGLPPKGMPKSFWKALRQRDKFAVAASHVNPQRVALKAKLNERSQPVEQFAVLSPSNASTDLGGNLLRTSKLPKQPVQEKLVPDSFQLNRKARESEISKLRDFLANGDRFSAHVWDHHGYSRQFDTCKVELLLDQSIIFHSGSASTQYPIQTINVDLVKLG